jgi:hypothetical protein
VSSRPSSASLVWTTMVVIAALALAACSSPTPAATPGASSPVLVTPPAASPIETSPLATTPAPTAAGGGGNANVNLTFTGTAAFDAKGTKGICKVLQVNGTPRFGFEATDADYPGLGVSYSMVELNANSVDVKWLVNATTSYGNNPGSHIDLGADHRTITIDQDLVPFTAGGVKAGPEHVRGVISCP